MKESLKCCCIYCKDEKSVMGLHTHVDRTHLGKTQYSSGNNGKYEIIAKNNEEKQRKKKEEYELSPKVCTTCHVILSFVDRRNKFCSRSCTMQTVNKLRKESGWKLSDESKVKLKDSLEIHRKEFGVKGRAFKPLEDKSCENCLTIFRHRRNASCSQKCGNEIKRKKADLRRAPFKNYSVRCKFSFDLKDFADEFDFSLIEKYGWYKAKNRGDNMNGISRDHMISVRYGFDNDIDPEVIKHPANCCLLRHMDNATKQMKCSISIEELYDRIEKWDLKYKRI